MNGETRIKVLGSGCPSCKKLYKRVMKAAEPLGLGDKVDYVTDIEEIIRLGAVSTPVLAVDNTLISTGRVPSEPEIKEVLVTFFKVQAE